MNAPRSQLYRIRAVDVPYSAMRLAQGMRVQFQHIPEMPCMYWPNHKPCEPVNMYFLDIAQSVSGSSLGTYASELSHLVRYCGNKSIGFEGLTDGDFFALVEDLQAEMSARSPVERARNNNTIRSILGRSIRFLQWYQERLMSAMRTPLIGEASISPQIQVTRVRNQAAKSKRAEYYFVHRAMPPPESRDPKRPIAQPVIEDIARCIDSKSSLELLNARYVRRFRTRPHLLDAHVRYLRCRRHFMIWLMKRTGLRPAEMVEISVKDHLRILNDKRLLIPTKKRRRVVAPKRTFPISLIDAAVVERYLIARAKFCDAISKSDPGTLDGDALFLGIDGRPIMKKSLEREFARLVAAAGYKDVQACFSMFRHRFITFEVVVHLKEFMAKAGKSRQMMTKDDYESILKRVATKTGHGSTQSLWHYIDLAWTEIDVWGGIDKAIARMHAADRLFDELLALKFDVESAGGSTAERARLFEFASRLEKIIALASEELAAQRIHGKRT